jgi:hypothetical protein
MATYHDRNNGKLSKTHNQINFRLDKETFELLERIAYKRKFLLWDGRPNLTATFRNLIHEAAKQYPQREVKRKRPPISGLTGRLAALGIAAPEKPKTE